MKRVVPIEGFRAWSKSISESGLVSRCFKILLYVLGVAIFVTIGLEVLLRLLAANPDNYLPFRFGFVSPNSFISRGDRIWTYRPNAVIREVAVYGMPSVFPPRLRFTVEYDCRMQSNNLGLLQDDDVAPGTNVTVVVGDSFTAGVGGCPWFPRLQARRSQDRLINAGLMGTGFEQWWRLVKFIGDQGFIIKRLLIVSITDDFKRRAWNWPERELACIDNNLCPKSAYVPEFSSIPSMWQPLRLTEPQDELTKRATALFYERFPQPEGFFTLRFYLGEHSFLVKFSRRARDNLVAMIAGSEFKRSRPETEAALESFKALGIPLQVLLVPQRNEVGLVGDRAGGDAAVATLKSHGIAHRWCPLSRNDFLPIDPHPNRAGYDKLMACADEALNNMK
jgi:hypothetical protein